MSLSFEIKEMPADSCRCITGCIGMPLIKQPPMKSSLLLPPAVNHAISRFLSTALAINNNLKGNYGFIPLFLPTLKFSIRLITYGQIDLSGSCHGNHRFIVHVC